MMLIFCNNPIYKQIKLLQDNAGGQKASTFDCQYRFNSDRRLRFVAIVVAPLILHNGYYRTEEILDKGILSYKFAHE